MCAAGARRARPWPSAKGVVSVIVNGTVVNRAEAVFPSSGPILLQCEGSEIFFRRFELHPLEGR